MGGSASLDPHARDSCFISCFARDSPHELEQDELESRAALIPIVSESGKHTPALEFNEDPASSRQPSKRFTPMEVQTAEHSVVIDSSESPRRPVAAPFHSPNVPREVTASLPVYNTPEPNYPSPGMNGWTPENCPERPQIGDLVSLKTSMLPELAGKCAIVTSTNEFHCTVAVLDDSHSLCLGELWPNFEDVTIQSQDWRLGSRVMIGGFTSSKARQLNGMLGTITSHPRSGHPTFICKPTSPEKARLTLCIRLDDTSPGSASPNQCVLIEPQFLRNRRASVADVVDSLTTVANDSPQLPILR